MEVMKVSTEFNLTTSRQVIRGLRSIACLPLAVNEHIIHNISPWLDKEKQQGGGSFD